MTKETPKLLALIAAVVTTFACANALELNSKAEVDPEEEITTTTEGELHLLPMVIKEPIVVASAKQIPEATEATITTTAEPQTTIITEDAITSDIYSPNSWFSREYLDLNMAIKEYADQFASFTFHGVEFDGLAVMAQANTESAYMANINQTLTALYPSMFVDLTSEADIASLDITKVWGNKKALNGVYLSIPYWDGKAGPFYAWSTGDGIYEQGPLQQRYVPRCAEEMEGFKSELQKLTESGVISTAKNTLFGYEATNLCTGNDYLNYKLGYKTTGDRWAIKDNCIMWRTCKEATLEKLWDNYYSTCGYTPNKYEYLAIMSYTHWIPSVIEGNTDRATARYYGFAYMNAWYDLSHQLSSDAAIEVIRKYAYQEINKNRSLLETGLYTKEDINNLFQLAIPAGSTTNVKESIPWQIFNELSSAGIVDSGTVLLHPGYGYQHAMKYAIQYLYAYELLDILLMEEY